MAGDFEPPHFIPDAYWLDHENNVVAIYEVENTSSVTRDKLDLYMNLWWALDNEFWGIVLVILPRAGKPYVVDIGDAAIDRVFKEAAESTAL